MDSLDTEVDANSLAGAAICYPLAPRDLGGTLAITQGPQDTTAEDNHVTSFTVQVSNPGQAAVFYQWYRNGVAISSNANSATYTFVATTDDNGAKYSVLASKVGSSAASGEATLTVVPDVTRPRVLSVTASQTNLALVLVQLDEFMEESTAEDEFYYLVDGTINPVNATLQPNGSSVELEFNPPLLPNTLYNIDIAGLIDLVNLTINPDPTSLTFRTSTLGVPDLRIAILGTDVEISWPAPSDGYLLESSPAIVTPVASMEWFPVSTPPVVVNNRNVVTVPLESGNRIFRLRQ